MQKTDCVAGRGLFFACALAALLGACTVAGPRAIENGRLVYNTAITKTNNQQILMAVLQNRYLESQNLLTVASVTANVRVTTRADVQLGIGDASNYAGNLVPFSASAIYEENPTISYTPVAGSRYMRQLHSPTPISVLAQLSATQTDLAPLYYALISSVNGIRNPDFMFSSARPDPRFARFVDLVVELIRGQRLYWLAERDRDGGFSIVIQRDSGAADESVDELLALLGLPANRKGTGRVRLPVSLTMNEHESGGVGIATRSVYQLANLLSASVDVPEVDQADGAAAEYPPTGPAGNGLRVYRSTGSPNRAAVTVPYRDAWYYIDDGDRDTKRFFRTLTSLWSAAIADNTVTSASTPVLTVPVSR